MIIAGNHKYKVTFLAKKLPIAKQNTILPLLYMILNEVAYLFF